jgi:hypothetical protein
MSARARGGAAALNVVSRMLDGYRDGSTLLSIDFQQAPRQAGCVATGDSLGRLLEY